MLYSQQFQPIKFIIMKDKKLKTLHPLTYFSLLFMLLCFGCSDNLEIDHEAVISDSNEIESRQIQFNQDLWQLITPCEASNLTYFLDPSCVGSPYEDVYHAAMREYNQLDLTIQFTPVQNAAEADLVFVCRDGGVCGGANASAPFDEDDLPGFSAPNVQTFFDSGGSIGGQIDFSINWDRCPCTDEDSCNFLDFEPLCMFKKTIMHEVGHVLGIAHNSETFGTLIEGSNPDTYQPGSVFNAGPNADRGCRWCQDCEFTEDDIFALESLYGCPDQIDVTLEVCEGNLNSGKSVLVTSTPSADAPYTVWAIFDGIPTRFFVHRQCSEQPLTTEYQLQNVPVGTTISFHVEQCDTYEQVAEHQITSVGYVPTLNINDSYPRLGENVNISSSATKAMDYQIRLRYELWGQTQYQAVSNVSCGNSSSNNVTLFGNSSLAYKTVWIEALINGIKVNEKSFTIFP